MTNCKFCGGTSSSFPERIIDEVHTMFGFVDIKTEVGICLENQSDASLYNSIIIGDEQFKSKWKINFCPICGRKLNPEYKAYR